MRSKTFKLAPLTGVLFLSGFIILFPFFTSKAQKVKKEIAREQQSDSPRNKTIIIKNGDLDKAMADLDRVNVDSISITVNAALSAINFDEIGKSIEVSMKSIDAKKIRLDVEQSLKDIKMPNIKIEIDGEVIELKNKDWQKDLEKGMKEMEAGLKEMKKVNFEEIKIDLAKAKKEIADVDMKGAMAKAKVEIEKAKKDIQQLKSTLDEMKKDGLIDDTKSLRLEWKKDRLYINGKEQTEAVSEKYKALKESRFSGNNNDDDEDNDGDTEL